MDKKSYLLLMCLALFISIYLTSCKREDAKVVSKIQDGFISVNELNNRADGILRCVLWETQISFMDDSEYICIYQASFIDNPNLIVKYKKEYYVNEAKYSQLTEIAALAREERQRIYNLGDTVEILGSDKNYDITIIRIEANIIEGQKIIDIKYSVETDITENELKSIFSFVEITVGSTKGNDNIMDFIDAETVRIEMKAHSKLDAIILKSPEYPGLNYKVVVDE